MRDHGRPPPASCPARRGRRHRAAHGVDSGPGIAPSVMSQVFPAVRHDQARARRGARARSGAPRRSALRCTDHVPKRVRRGRGLRDHRSRVRPPPRCPATRSDAPVPSAPQRADPRRRRRSRPRHGDPASRAKRLRGGHGLRFDTRSSSPDAAVRSRLCDIRHAQAQRPSTSVRRSRERLRGQIALMTGWEAKSVPRRSPGGRLRSDPVESRSSARDLVRAIGALPRTESEPDRAASASPSEPRFSLLVDARTPCGRPRQQPKRHVGRAREQRRVVARPRTAVAAACISSTGARIWPETVRRAVRERGPDLRAAALRPRRVVEVDDAAARPRLGVEEVGAESDAEIEVRPLREHARRRRRTARAAARSCEAHHDASTSWLRAASTIAMSRVPRRLRRATHDSAGVNAEAPAAHLAITSCSLLRLGRVSSVVPVRVGSRRHTRRDRR